VPGGGGGARPAGREGALNRNGTPGHLVVQVLEVVVQPRVEAFTRFADDGRNLLPYLSRGVAEEIVDEVELDQLPAQQYSDLVLEAEHV
jgi:hypothetical protein